MIRHIRKFEGKDNRYSRQLVVGLLLVSIGLDYLTGPYITMLPMYLVIIALTAWLLNPWWVIGISSLSVLGRALIYQQQEAPVPMLLSVVDTISNALVFLIVIYLVEMLKKKLKELTDVASTDHLTQINNRKYFYELGAAEIARSNRHHSPFTIAFIDLDNFKQVNDRMGHAMGDQVLTAVASTIKQNLRGGDILGRLGGDEFAVLLHHTNQQQAQVFVEKIRASLHQAVGSLDDNVDFSVGVVTNASNADLAISDLLSVADHAMYEIKQSSKGATRYVVL